MTKQRGGNGGSRATIGDALPSTMKARMIELRNDLQRRAQAAIEAQLKRARAPWQSKRPASKPSVHAAPGTARIKRAGAAVAPVKAPRAESRISRVASTSGGGILERRKSPAKAPTQPDSFAFWTLPPEAAVREPPPVSISTRDRESFEQLIARGSGSAPEAGDKLFVTIGLDFGTSSTKVIVRLPYEAGVPTIAIPAPRHCRSDNHPYLWQTVLWVRGNGEFIAWPEPGAALLHSLKQGVMGAHADEPIGQRGDRGMAPTRTDAAAAFLALVIRHARGWLLENRPNLFRQRQPIWFVNIGLPAANLDNRVLISNYRRAGAAALLLANLPGPVNTETTQLLLKDANVSAAASSVAQGEALGIAVIPETAAEATGFAKSTNRAPGVYLLVDVGAMTLDVCAFRLGRNRGSQDLYALFSAQVRPLGVEAYHWFQNQGKTADAFAQQCDRCLREVTWDTKKSRDPTADCWRQGNDLSVFLAGGGAQHDLHRRIVKALGAWLKEYTGNDGIRLLDLPKPAVIDLPEANNSFTRLSVAWGLSYPPTDIGEIMPPSAIEDIPARAALDLSSLFISKDNM